MDDILKIFFRIGAIIYCGHASAAIFGLSQHLRRAKEEMFIPVSTLSEEKKASLIFDISQLLQNNSAQYVLWGDYNHFDMRILGILADPDMLRILKNAGIERIFIEIPMKYQKQIETLEEDVRLDSPLANLHGPRVDAEVRRLTVELIKNAKAQGIKIFGMDDRSKISTLFVFNKLAVSVEAKILNAVGLKALSRWWCHTFGEYPYIKNRLDERRAVARIKQNSIGCGRTLIVRGSAHLVIGGKKTLRAGLENNLAMDFYDPDMDKTAVIHGAVAIPEMADFLTVLGFNPPDCIANLGTGRVEKYFQDVRLG